MAVTSACVLLTGKERIVMSQTSAVKIYVIIIRFVLSPTEISGVDVVPAGPASDVTKTLTNVYITLATIQRLLSV